MNAAQAFFVGIMFLAVMTFAGIAMEPYFNATDYVESDLLKINGQTIIVGKGCTAIMADTSPERADAIRQGLEGVIEYRPSVYDNFVHVMENFNLTLESVTLEGFDGQFYYSNLVIRTPEKVLKIDSKPSDAFALAVRADVPIYINATLLEEIGKEVC